MKLEKKQVHLDIRKYFFIQKVIDYWNALSQSAIDAENINQFKDQLDIYLYNIIRGLNKPLALKLYYSNGGSRPKIGLQNHSVGSRDNSHLEILSILMKQKRCFIRNINRFAIIYMFISYSHDILLYYDKHYYEYTQ